MKTTIELAREAGFEHDAKDIIWTEDRDGDCTKELKAFEALVRADERDAMCDIVDYELDSNGHAEAIKLAIRARGNT